MMNAIKSFVLTAMMFAISSSHAGDIHQWRDKDGRLHFGDSQNAPSGSKIIPVQTKENNTAAVAEADKANPGKDLGMQPMPPIPPMPLMPPPQLSENKVGGNAGYDRGAAPGVTTVQVAQCSGMAREHLSQQTSPSEIRTFFVKLESICPKTGFICKSYKLSPQKDHCEPVQYRDGKNKISLQVYNS